MPFILVGTKSDLRDSKEKSEFITTEQAEALKNELGAYKYLECSALTQKGLETVFQQAVQCILLNPQQPTEGFGASGDFADSENIGEVAKSSCGSFEEIQAPSTEAYAFTDDLAEDFEAQATVAMGAEFQDCSVADADAAISEGAKMKCVVVG